MTREREGLLLCLVSAACFGAMPIFAKQAYATGLGITPLLALRFAMAAAMLWTLIALRRRPLGSARGLVAGVALGLFGYSVQAGFYFGALERIDAGLASLLLYAYPAFVTVAAIALRRESPSRRKLGALALASGGVALVLLGGGPGAIDLVGAAMAIGSALFYTVFILASDSVADHSPPVPFAASVATGSALTFGIAALVDGGISASGEGVMWAAIIASISTVMPIVLFMAGLARVGPSTASIASTIEPPFTVALAWIVFGETLGPLQLAGGALVLSAVIVLQLRRAASSPRSASAESPPARISVRQSSSVPPELSHAQVSATVAASGRGASPAAAVRVPDTA
jgi:drug/metabolite transporter (DMT)-like permease